MTNDIEELKASLANWERQQASFPTINTQEKECNHCTRTFKPKPEWQIHCSRCIARRRTHGMYQLPKPYKSKTRSKAIFRATSKLLSQATVDHSVSFKACLTALHKAFPEPTVTYLPAYRNIPRLVELDTVASRQSYLTWYLRDIPPQELITTALSLHAILIDDWSIIRHAGESVRCIWLGNELLKHYGLPKIRRGRRIGYLNHLESTIKYRIGKALLPALQGLYADIEPSFQDMLNAELKVAKRRRDAWTPLARIEKAESVKRKQWPVMEYCLYSKQLFTLDCGNWRQATQAERDSYRRFEYHSPQ